MKTLYVIGSLRSPNAPIVGKLLRAKGLDVFEEWHAAGPIADDEWMRYEKDRGRSYIEALQGYAASHVFEFDLYHLNRAHGALLAMPAGKSAHLELGYMIGQGKPGWVLFDQEPERWDVMYKFATEVFFDTDTCIERLSEWGTSTE